MGYPTKVQLIKRKASEQWYVNFPAAIALAMEFQKGETVEWVIKDRFTLTLRRKEAREEQAQKKTLELLPEIEAIWAECRDAFRQHRTWKRARRLGLSQLACLGRHTLAGLICAGGRQGDDGSADYRLFARDRWNPDDLFAPVVRGALHMLPDDAPLVTALDDTRLRKTGRKIPGVGYGRDPMSPPFHTNLVAGQRFVQVSAMVPAGQVPSPARGVPVRFHHQPPVPKPKASAGDEVQKAYRKMCRQNNLSTCGRDLIRKLREEMDPRHLARGRKLVITGDGSYTNKTILRTLPDRTTFIGRIRKDAKLYRPPRADQQPSVGSKRRYGDVAPTPEALRKDDRVPWRPVRAYASGKTHTFRIKEMTPVLWRKAGADLPVRIVVVAPVGYRLRKGGKLLYRRPAYLLATDLDMPIEALVQYYLWRWDIEVNHRDEKQLIGVGQAQVWSRRSVQRQPALAVAGYAYLLLAALRVYGIDERGPVIPVPKWQKANAHHVSTQKLLQKLRSEIWAYAVERPQRDSTDQRPERDSTDFVTHPPATTKSQESMTSLAAAAIFARAG